MGVDIQRKFRRGVTEDFRNRFRVNTTLNCQCRECVSEVMEADVFFDSRLFQQLLMNPSNAVRTIHSTSLGDGNIYGLNG